MSDYTLELYKLITMSFDNEITRFWSRFNILMGTQMVGFVGVFASAKTLFLNPGLFRLALILMTFYSMATTAIVIRGYIMHETLLKMIIWIERESEGKIRILALSEEASKVPIGLNQIFAICISVVFSVGWIIFLIFAESRHYAFIIPE